MASPPKNLTLGDEVFVPVAPLEREVREAVTRISEVLAALRLGRSIDAHEVLIDIRSDLRAALNEPA